MHALRLSVAFTGLIVWTIAAHAATLTPEDAAKHVGQHATVCGLIVATKYAPQSKGGPTFLDFGKPYPNAVFTALILGTDRAKFGAPEKDWQSKEACVTGEIKLYRGNPEIILTDPKQLTGK